MFLGRYPTLKRWAILICPSGTGTLFRSAFMGNLRAGKCNFTAEARRTQRRHAEEILFICAILMDSTAAAHQGSRRRVGNRSPKKGRYEAEKPGAPASLPASQQARIHAGRDAGAPGAGTVRSLTVSIGFGKVALSKPTPRFWR